MRGFYRCGLAFFKTVHDIFYVRYCAIKYGRPWISRLRRGVKYRNCWVWLKCIQTVTLSTTDDLCSGTKNETIDETVETVPLPGLSL